MQFNAVPEQLTVDMAELCPNLVSHALHVWSYIWGRVSPDAWHCVKHPNLGLQQKHCTATSSAAAADLLHLHNEHL